MLDYTLFVCGSDNTFDDVIVDGLRHGAGDPARKGGLQVMESATGTVFANGEIRGVWDSKGFQGGADRMLIANTTFRDIRLTPAGAAVDVHNECAYVTAGNNQVWRGNRFLLCPVMAMFFANYVGGPPFTGVVVEHNVFTHALNGAGTWHDGAAFVIPNGQDGQNQVNNWVVRYNTFEVPPDISSHAVDRRRQRLGALLRQPRRRRRLRHPGVDVQLQRRRDLRWQGRGAGPAGNQRAELARTRRRSTSTPRASTSAFAPAQRRSIGVTPPPTRRSTPTASGGRSAASRTRAPTSSDPVCWSPAISVRARAHGVPPPPRCGGSSRRTRRTSSISLGNNDSTHGRGFAAAWRSSFAWLPEARIDVAGALGPADRSARSGGYQYATLGMPGAYYVRRLRDVEVIVLDSTRVTAAQTAWLQQTLSAPSTRFRMVVLHHPPFSCGSRAGGCCRREGMGAAPRATRRASRCLRERARLPALPQGAGHLCRRNRRVDAGEAVPAVPPRLSAAPCRKAWPGVRLRDRRCGARPGSRGRPRRQDDRPLPRRVTRRAQ